MISSINWIFLRRYVWTQFYHKEFTLDYFTVDWPHTLKFENNNIDPSFQNFFDSVNDILDKHA